MEEFNLIQLRAIQNGMLDTYSYLLARYLNKPRINLENYREYDNLRSYNWIDSDLFEAANVNTIKSVIDTLVSKLANNKTRPFFTPVNGDYNTEQIVKQAQQYFDLVFDKLGVHNIIRRAFWNACVFRIGHIIIDPFTYTIESIPSWQIATLNSEDDKTCFLITKRGINKSELVKYNIEISENYCDFEMFVTNSEAIIFINGEEKKRTKCNTLPLVRVFYNEPVRGNITISIVEELEGIQNQIDWINHKITKQLQLRPGLMTFINTNSNLTASDVTNEDGVIYEIDMPLDATQLPVHNFEMPSFDESLLRAQDYYDQKASEIIGISELSRQSKKPSGLDSGVALQTMEDIESDRFETQVTHYTNTYVELAKLMIDFLPEDDNILPTTKTESSFTWKDLKENSSLFKIQYSAASALSKDPAEKTKQLLQWTQIGLIGPEDVANMTNLPDLQKAWRGAAAISDAINKCISNAIESEIYEIPDYLNYQQLAQKIAITENKLYASVSGKNKKNDREVLESLRRVMILDEKLTSLMEENGFIENQPVEAVTTEEGQGINNMNSAIQATSASTEALTQPLNDVETMNETTEGI